MNSSDKLKDGLQFVAHYWVYYYSFAIHSPYVKTEGLHYFVHCLRDMTAIIAIEAELAVSTIAAITEHRDG